MHITEYLAGSVWSRDDIDHFLDPTRPSWARFDALTGYVPSDIVIRDGVDGCSTFNSYVDLGPQATVDSRHRPVVRRRVHDPDGPCRLNTYGDSFTQCHQVSDGETWQEILTAHLGEPIRNFGVGGYGVYQAFARMRAIEPTPTGADYVVLNIFDDDHIRNLDAARWFRLDRFRTTMGSGLAQMLHANPWVHLRLDLDSGAFVERPNPLPTPDSAYQLADPAYVVETYRADPVVALDCLGRGVTVDDLVPLEQLAEALGRPVDLRGGDTATAANELLVAYGLAATIATLSMVRTFLADRDKHLLVMLSYSSGTVVDAIEGRPRFDQTIVDDLAVHGDPLVDALAAHVRDHGDFALSAEQYCRRYFAGHYTPAGNHFFAFAVKDALVDWLDPRPPAYRSSAAAVGDPAATLA